jgi:hypothetical protein
MFVRTGGWLGLRGRGWGVGGGGPERGTDRDGPRGHPPQSLHHRRTCALKGNREPQSLHHGWRRTEPLSVHHSWRETEPLSRHHGWRGTEPQSLHHRRTGTERRPYVTVMAIRATKMGNGLRCSECLATCSGGAAVLLEAGLVVEETLAEADALGGYLDEFIV